MQMHSRPLFLKRPMVHCLGQRLFLERLGTAGVGLKKKCSWRTHFQSFLKKITLFCQKGGPGVLFPIRS